jgi:hypothetical protein
MTTSTFQELDRPEGNGSGTSQGTTATPKDTIAFWAIVDASEDALSLET